MKEKRKQRSIELIHRQSKFIDFAWPFTMEQQLIHRGEMVVINLIASSKK
jgi:hypothetical protein